MGGREIVDFEFEASWEWIQNFENRCQMVVYNLKALETLEKSSLLIKACFLRENEREGYLKVSFLNMKRLRRPREMENS